MMTRTLLTPATQRRFAQASIVLAICGSSAHAQQAPLPDIGDALRQARPPTTPTAPQTPLPIIDSPLPAPMSRLPGDAELIEVRSFALVGHRVIDTETLLAQLRPHVGKSLTFADLEALASRLTQFYRAQGFFVARAYVPAQEVVEGQVTFRIVEGNYGRFHLRNGSRVRDDIVQAMLDDVKDADIVSLDTLERAMLLINDTPGAQVVQADVMPGTQIGTSDFAVGTTATPAYTGVAMIDNHGSRYTGKRRVSFNFDANSPTGRGERISVSGLASDSGDLAHARLSYSALLAPNGMRGELALGRTAYQLGDSYEILDARGKANSLDATLTYPLKRTRVRSVEASFNLGHKRLEDEIRLFSISTPKELTTGSLGLSFRDESDLVGLAGATHASAGLTFGQLRIGDAAARAADLAGPQTEGSFRKLTIGISRAMRLSSDFQLSVGLKHQRSFNRKNLDPSERMAVSGPSAVMAYPSGELAGTRATLIRMELSRALPELGPLTRLNTRGFGFLDWGQAAAARPVVAADRSRDIADVGFGVSGSYANAFLKVSWAHRLRAQPPSSEPAPRNKVLVQGGWVF